MAREVVINSDLSGQPGARTYTLAYDSVRYEIDLTDEEVKPVLDIFNQGRTSHEPEGGGRGMRSLDDRIRNIPPKGEET